MDDKNKMAKLYEKMNYIDIMLKELIENTNNFTEELNTTFQIDNKMIEEEQITKNKEAISNIKKSVKLDILNDLKNRL